MFCYHDFLSYIKDNYPKSLPFALKSSLGFEIHRVMFSLLRCLLLPSPFSLLALNFRLGVLAPEDSVSVSNLPLRGFTAGCWIRRCCVCCSVPFTWEIAWDSPIVNIVSQTMNNQERAYSGFQLSPAWRLDREMRRRSILQETRFTR